MMRTKHPGNTLAGARVMREGARGLSLVEAAVLVALLGSLAAIAAPTCARELRASKLAEPVDGVSRISATAVALDALPAPAPLTPAKPPRGRAEVDPPGTWDHPTWQALGFRPGPEGVPHAFAFAVDSTPADLAARAHGDLDGDGLMSTFEVRCVRDAAGARIVPGMYVESEVE